MTTDDRETSHEDAERHPRGRGPAHGRERLNQETADEDAEQHARGRGSAHGRQRLTRRPMMTTQSSIRVGVGARIDDNG